MHIAPINNTQQNFKAEVKPTKEFGQLMSYLQEHLDVKYYDYSKDMDLVQKVTRALNAYPTDAELKFSTMFRDGKKEIFTARGVVESQYAKLIDTEPARETSMVPIPNIMRRILNPANKDQFNKLMGNAGDNVREIWWKFYIEPIWDSIKARFYEDTIYKRDTLPDFDLMFRNNNKV